MGNLDKAYISHNLETSVNNTQDVCYNTSRDITSFQSKSQRESLRQENTTENAINFIKIAEGFRNKAYKDSAGVWTIGWGTIEINGERVKKGDNITQENAEIELRKDVKKRVAILMKKPWFHRFNSHQKAAFISFSYNLGMGIFDKGASLKKIIHDDNSTPRQIAQIMMKYVYAGGKRINGLVNRRNKEVELFLTPMQLKENQTFSIIYKGDTLGKNIKRLVKSYNNIDIDSGVLSKDLESIDGLNLESIEAYQTIIMNYKCDNTFEFTIAEKGTFSIDLSIYEIKKEKEITEEVKVASIENNHTNIIQIEGKKGQGLGGLIGNMIRDFGPLRFTEVLPTVDTSNIITADNRLIVDTTVALRSDNKLTINGLPIYNVFKLT